MCSAGSRLPWENRGENFLRDDTERESAGGKITALEETAVVCCMMGVARTLVGFAVSLEWISGPNVQLLVVPDSRKLFRDCPCPDVCIYYSHRLDSTN